MQRLEVCATSAKTKQVWGRAAVQHHACSAQGAAPVRRALASHEGAARGVLLLLHTRPMTWSLCLSTTRTRNARRCAQGEKQVTVPLAVEAWRGSTARKVTTRRPAESPKRAICGSIFSHASTYLQERPRVLLGWAGKTRINIGSHGDAAALLPRPLLKRPKVAGDRVGPDERDHVALMRARALDVRSGHRLAPGLTAFATHCGYSASFSVSLICSSGRCGSTACASFERRLESEKAEERPREIGSIAAAMISLPKPLQRGTRQF